jgi:hypothetical protein
MRGDSVGSRTQAAHERHHVPNRVTRLAYFCRAVRGLVRRFAGYPRAVEAEQTQALIAGAPAFTLHRDELILGEAWRGWKVRAGAIVDPETPASGRESRHETCNRTADLLSLYGLVVQVTKVSKATLSQRIAGRFSPVDRSGETRHPSAARPTTAPSRSPAGCHDRCAGET